jgi:hypothetical protein
MCRSRNASRKCSIHLWPARRLQEIELLLCCVRNGFDPQPPTEIEQLAANVEDWEYVYQAALHHGVLPLVCRTLTGSRPSSIPSPLIKRLQELAVANARRNLLLTGRLLRLLSFFESRHITAVPFKGPALSEAIYGDVGLRTFVDLDILVNRRDAWRVLQLLLAKGYHPEVQLQEDQIGAYVRTEYSLALSSQEREVIVEIHWDLTGRYLSARFGLDQFGDRLVCAKLLTRDIQAIPPEESLLYLCIHGSKDGWNELEAIASVAASIRSTPYLGWERVRRVAMRMRCNRLFLLGMALVTELFNAELPRSLQEEITQDRAVRDLAMEICRKLFPESTLELQNRGCSDFSSYHLKVRDTALEKVLFIMRLMFRPSREDWRRHPLAPRWAFLLYLLRPLRLAAMRSSRAI